MSDLLARSDLIVIFVYMGAMLVVAAWVSKSSRSVEGYTVGNRNMAGWVVGISVLGTFTSSMTFLGLPSKTYAGNWNAFVFSLTLPFAAIIGVRYFVPLYRGGVTFSAYEFLEARFGYGARLYADVCYVLLQLIRVAMVLLLVALAVQPMLDWEIVPTLIGLGLLVIIYDTLGGIQAVIWTDVFQVIILVGGALWCLAVLLLDPPGGAEASLLNLPAGKLSLGSWDATTLAHPTVWVMLVYGLTENLRNYGTDQNYVQRFLTARSDREAAKSIWIGALAYPPLSIVFCLIGTALAMSYSGDLLPEGTRPDQVFPLFIQTQLPKPVAGLVIAAILAAAMSTVDSSLNSTSTVLLVDVFRRIRRGKEPRIPEIITLRLSTVTLGVVGTTMAVWIYEIFQDESGTIMDMWWKYAGVAGGGLFGLFLLAWLFPQVPRGGVALGVLASIPVLLWGLVMRDPQQWDWMACTLDGNLIGVTGTIVLMLVALGSWVVAGMPPRPSDPPREKGQVSP
jgi:SSS family solute:Na+ symporter